MSWVVFYDENRKIVYKFCINDFLNNIKELGAKRIFFDTVPFIMISRISTYNLESLVLILTELYIIKNIIEKNRNRCTL